VFTIGLSDNATLLYYLEESGDYINSTNMPSVVNVDEVYNHLNDYLIIDTRTNSEYIAGHIPGAVNIQNDSLITFLNSIEASTYAKVILVSKDGQASSYYTCLLRLYGITNTYSLLFGMTQWNLAFSGAWSNNIDDSPVTQYFNFDTYTNDSLSNLPTINFSNSNKSFENKVKDRIDEIIKVGFINGESYVSIYPLELLFNGEPASDFYIICYGILPFYHQNPFDPLAVGHFPNAVSFVPGKNLKSTDNLQLLPNENKIVVYSYSGQLSAFVVAYLRLLGYDAKSLLYGGNMLFYTYMVDKFATYDPFVFLTSNIRNYPYVSP
jgi:rhodanese-related sulfurtransferase